MNRVSKLLLVIIVLLVIALAVSIARIIYYKGAIQDVGTAATEYSKAMQDAGIKTVLTDNEMYVWVTDQNRVVVVNENVFNSGILDNETINALGLEK